MPSAVSGPTVFPLLRGPVIQVLPGPGLWLLSQLYLIILNYWEAAIIVSQKAIGVVFKASVRLELGSPGIHGCLFLFRIQEHVASAPNSVTAAGR